MISETMNHDPPGHDHDVAGERETFCTFRVDDLLFGVEVRRVQEVIRSQPTTRVPLAPKVVQGLMNLRGQIVEALSLREKLGIDSDPSVAAEMNVVLRTKEGPVSLLVDEIGDVVQVDQRTFEPPPETLRGDQRALVRGAFKLPSELLLILNTDLVTNIAA